MTAKRKTVFKTIAVVLAICILAAIFISTRPDPDSIKFEGKKYSVLGYPANVFVYDLSTGGEFEEDEKYPIPNCQWDMIYHNCDVYCSKSDFSEASAYYDNYDNYDWFVNIEKGDEEQMYPITVSGEDGEYIYTIDEIDKETAIFFDEIETMGSLLVISRDGVIRGTTSIGKYSGQWYWRSEIIDESRERDGEWPEYIIRLPEKVNREIIYKYKGTLE